MLEAFFALLGLTLAIYNWELNFESRREISFEELAAEQSTNFLEGVVLLTSLLAIIAMLVKEYCNAMWYEYK